ncbi:MAG: CPBP family intramembrane metalloprotease [Anaerolineaceae bacterium]|nr:CPBP family intramembrane metalloprotease [Anaerolineaceae bacterium]
MESQISSDIIAALPDTAATKVNWNQVGTFIGLTFGLTWLLDLVLFRSGGLQSPVSLLALQLQMLLPAFSAILLGMFFFKNSPINIKNNHSKSRWFTWYFLLYSLLYIAAVIFSFIRPDMVQTISPFMLIPGLLGLILVIVLRAVGGKNTFAGVGMGAGKGKLWLLFGIGIVLFAGLQTLLSWLFKMGQPVDLSALIAQGMAAGMTPPLFMTIVTVQTILLGPFLGLMVSFGEEYGWRGYLQPALIGLGRVRGVTLVGVIWGIWHWPVIWMGYNYPGHPFLGSLLMVIFCLGLAFLLGYAVLKAKGLWIAAFLHALVNQSFSYFMGVIYIPDDPTYSFGIGIPGLIVFALVVVLILRDPIWKQKD